LLDSLLQEPIFQRKVITYRVIIIIKPFNPVHPHLCGQQEGPGSSDQPDPQACYDGSIWRPIYKVIRVFGFIIS